MATANVLDATLASRGNRLLGQFIDGIIGGAPVFVAILAAGATQWVAPLIVIALCWSGFYYLFADGFRGGQSFAKRWLNMRVVDANTFAPCTFTQSFLRNLLLAVLGPIDWVFIFGERHQRLGDKAAGTIVITD